VNTPKWALSDEWKEELHRREEEMVRVEEAERNDNEACDDEEIRV